MKYTRRKGGSSSRARAAAQRARRLANKSSKNPRRFPPTIRESIENSSVLDRMSDESRVTSARNRAQSERNIGRAMKFITAMALIGVGVNKISTEHQLSEIIKEKNSHISSINSEISNLERNSQTFEDDEHGFVKPDNRAQINELKKIKEKLAKLTKVKLKKLSQGAQKNRVEKLTRRWKSTQPISTKRRGRGKKRRK